MILEIAKKLQEMSCEFSSSLKQKLDEENYGLKNCSSNLITCLDSNSKFNKLKKDYLKYYSNYTQNEILSIANDCDVINIIKQF